MKKLSYIYIAYWLICFGGALSMFSQETAAGNAGLSVPQKEKFHLFLLAGQSNMAGRGVVDAAGKTPSARVLSLDAAGAWKPAVDPLHWDKAGAGAGLGKPFGEIIAKKIDGVTIGLIPSACGGSPISTWAPGKYHNQTNSHPYDDALVRARRAMKEGTLKAILWHQGESDSNKVNAPAYEKRLEELINRLRRELGAPDLPFIIGQVGRWPERPWSEGQEQVDRAQQALAARMKNVRFVKANGLTSKDKLHFDTPSLRTFAERYAEAYLSCGKE